MIRPKNETGDLVLSITETCETLIKQTHRKTKETLGFKMTKSRQTFHFNPPIPIVGYCMVGLTSLEVYNFLFNITEHNNNFELYTDTFDGISFEELKGELEDIVKNSNSSSEQLQDEEIAPLIVSA